MDRRAFTLIELLVVIAIIAIVIAILLPVLGGARDEARKAKDATQVRGLVQGAIVFAGSNNELFPLPSVLDLAHTTVAITAGQPPLIKDNTGNIISAMVANGLTTPQELISPVEVNQNIEPYLHYSESPENAASPDAALWDPGLAGMPNESGSGGGDVRATALGNVSYAHLPPLGARREFWKASGAPGVALFGTRGPDYRDDDNDPATPAVLVAGARGDASARLRFYKPDNAWSGQVAFADGSVNYLLEPAPTRVKYEAADGMSYADNLFLNETEQSQDRSLMLGETNALLNIYTDVQVFEPNLFYAGTRVMPASD